MQGQADMQTRRSLEGHANSITMLLVHLCVAAVLRNADHSESTGDQGLQHKRMPTTAEGSRSVT
jgi:hypothetical protein